MYANPVTSEVKQLWIPGKYNGQCTTEDGWECVLFLNGIFYGFCQKCGLDKPVFLMGYFLCSLLKKKKITLQIL